MQSDERLIVALDFPTADLAKACVEELGDSVCHFKVGMELYYAAGSEIIRFLKEHNKKVFLDLKLHDIPNTVASALAVLTELGADMMNVHAIGGRKMMQEAVKAVHAKAAELGRPAPKLIAVTILTSINEEQYADLNYKTGIAEQVSYWKTKPSPLPKKPKKPVWTALLLLRRKQRPSAKHAAKAF